MEPVYKEDCSLSTCETIIMKAIWDKGEDISITELAETLRTKYNKDYKRKLLKDQTDFWYHGDAAKVVAALCSTANITQKEIETIRGILDDLDN